MSDPSGFTGNLCPDCGGCHMIRAGTCECCQHYYVDFTEAPAS